MPDDMQFDALKIYYHPILATDEVRDVTFLQGFSVSWRHVQWALDMIARLPADVLEKISKIDDIVAQRMGGLRSLSWAPLSIGPLESISVTDLAPLVVLFSGEEECAKRIAAWQANQERPVLHVSSIDVEGRADPATITLDTLRVHCGKVLKEFPKLFSDQQRAAAEAALPQWAEAPDSPSGLTIHDHNITRPNYTSLLRSGRSLEPGEPFIGKTEKEYTDLILETAKAVIKVRQDVGLRPFHGLTLLRPGVILAEPALYRINYKPTRAKGPNKEKIVGKVLRLIQKQKGLHNSNTLDFVQELEKSNLARALLADRASELRTFAAGLSIHAAQTAAAVVRLSPAVNHVFPALSSYARSDRSSQKLEARLKVRRLF
jgi:hypothetical protein